MSQSVWDTINPNTTSGTQLASLLDDFKNAVMSGLSGTTRPSETQAGGGWIDTTNDPTYWSYKVYDGTNDIEIFRINLSTLKASIPTTDAFFEISKTTADADGALLKFIKNRIANSGQVLDGDLVMDIQAVGRGDDASDPVVARIRVEALDNMTAAASGATIIFEATPSGSTTIQEIFRVVDGKMGVGTDAPDTTLDVEGSTGIQSKRIEDAVGPATITQKKKRATGFGATQSGDSIGKIAHQTTDDAGAASEVLSIETVATEAHTASAQGTSVSIKNTEDGATTPTEAIKVTDKVEHVKPSLVNALQVAIQDVASAAAITALSATKSIVRLTGTTATELQGIDATGDAKVITINNGSTADMTLKHEDAGATANDRLDLPEGGDLVIGPDQSVTMFYSSSDSKWKVKSSSVGGAAGGSGTGKKNFFEGGDFESNINLATVYDDGAGAYVDGDGGAPTAITVAEEVTTPLDGVRSLKITKASIDGSGEGVTLLSEAISSAYQGRNLFLEFEWDGTAANYTDGDLKVHGFSTGTDNTELTFNPLGGFNDDGTLPALKTKCVGYFTTSTDTDSTVRASLHLASDSATASTYDVIVDNCILGPDSLVPGAIITDWQDYTPATTGIGSPTFNIAQWKRVGDSVQFRYRFTTGTVSAVVASISPPADVAGFDNSIQYTAAAVTGQTSSPLFALAANINQTNDRIEFGGAGGGLGSLNGTSLGTGNLYSFTTGLIKVTNWSSGAMLSTTEVGLQTLSAKLYLGSNQNILSTLPTVVQVDTVDIDTHGIIDTANNKIVIPRDGRYIVNFHIRVDNYTDSEFFRGTIIKNGSTFIVQDSAPGASNTSQVGSSSIVNLNKGDELTITADSSADANYDVQAGIDRTFLEVTRLPDFTTFSIYGETDLIEASSGLASYVITADQWGDLTSIDLPAGEWDISYHAYYKSVGATTTVRIFSGIHTSSGNVTPGSEGSDFIAGRMNNTSGNAVTLTGSRKTVTPTSTTTYYLKGFAETSISNLQVAYRISARKVK